VIETKCLMISAPPDDAHSPLNVEAVRTESAVALQEIGSPAVMALQQELKQGSKRTRQLAEEILKQIKEIAEMDNGA